MNPNNLLVNIISLFICIFHLSQNIYAQDHSNVLDPNTIINQEPQLLYTDLISAPSGAFVTIWGQNIPKDATLICGDNPCKIISFNNDLNHPAHGNQPPRQKIVVEFNSGSGISLDNYNTLPFKINNGKIWEITPTGSIGSVLDSMQPGDVLYLHKGTYKTVDKKSYGYRKGYGSIIWATSKRNGLAVVGYPGEHVVLDLSSGTTGFDTVGNIQNWTIANIECAGSGFAVGKNQGLCINAGRAGSRRNLRVVGMYNHDTGVNGCCAFGVFSHTQDLYVLGNFSENTGTTSGKIHAIYHGGKGINKNVNFNFNRIRNHAGRRGIQIYGHKSGESMTGLSICYNDINNNHGTDGILLSFSDSDSTVLRSDPKRNWIHDALIQGNTVYSGAGSGIAIRAALADVEIKDNIVFDNLFSIYIDFVKKANIINNCIDRPPTLKQRTGVILSNNNTNYPYCLKN